MAAKYKTPRFLVPFKNYIRRRVSPQRLANYDIKLRTAQIEIPADDYIAINVLLTAIITLAAIPIFGLKAIIFLVGVPFLGLYFVPTWREQSALENMIKTTPNALLYMSALLRSGVPLIDAIAEIANSDFGMFSQEMKVVIDQIRGGRPTAEALKAVAVKYEKMPTIQRTFLIIADAYTRGAPLSDVLVAIADDLRTRYRLKQERKASTSMFVMTLGGSSALMAPLLMGMAANMTKSFDLSALGINLDFTPIINTLNQYVIIQAILAGYAIGVIREGNPIKGLRFIIMFPIVAYIVFRLALGMSLV